ncbi:cellulase family glycosylhydrolase [Daejeonella oryzae]|uniref:cellulase family glycosylhydrolase n=1 Tax=Daejeonella oryzae TaxID=1122943 RepID=UPI00040D3FE3|nr:cellulase family glycosylhydrolase [Daejeonella oryzae]
MRHSAKLSIGVIACLLIFFNIINAHAQGFLDVKGKYIVNDKGEKVLLRGMGLGGWMLQEGYMLRFPKEGQQHRIKASIEELIGKYKTNEFYAAWLNNHTRKADIDSMKAWGFNSVRLPMHFNLYTLAIEEEPVKGQNTWKEEGFAMTDSLLEWCKANQMYLILDLHAAPGGQGNDNNISDRDPNKVSLWDSEENKNKMIALWRKLAERYANEPWIGAYDIINEPNWGFMDPEDKNGLKESQNIPLKKLMVDVTNAIREVDKKHIIIIEGNGWGNNYNGILPPWDDKMVVSFHKYWNYNNQASIQHFLDIRDKYNVPVWLGETGENSNVWFNQAISLMERNEIGWCWWPLKKMGINNPLEIKVTEDYQQLLNFWAGKGPKPSAEAASKTLMQMSENTKIENNIIHYDVLDAMFRQVNSSAAIPFKKHITGRLIQAADFDLGRSNEAYYDTDSTEYYISTGTDRTGWNMGKAYRNEGVDIYPDSIENNSFYIGKIEDGEWLNYTVFSTENGSYSIKFNVASDKSGGKLTLKANETPAKFVEIPDTGGSQKWQTVSLNNIILNKGNNTIRIYMEKGGFNLKSFLFSK